MVTERLAANVSGAIVNQNDPETVRDGAPAYLVLIDGLIEGEPESIGLLLAGARLYGAYAALFVEEPERAARLADKSAEYAERALCLDLPAVCAVRAAQYQQFVPALETVTEAHLPALFTYASAVAGQIQARRGEWSAVADLPKAEAMMERVVALDEGFEGGQAHLYLGIMRTQLPPSLGGRPELGKRHFQRAIELSGGRNLVAKVELAERYARMVFDRELHDRLLREVLEAEAAEPGMTLSNTLAQRRAKRLLDSSNEYFME